MKTLSQSVLGRQWTYINTQLVSLMNEGLYNCHTAGVYSHSVCVCVFVFLWDQMSSEEQKARVSAECLQKKKKLIQYLDKLSRMVGVERWNILWQLCFYIRATREATCGVDVTYMKYFGHLITFVCPLNLIFALFYQRSVIVQYKV